MFPCLYSVLGHRRYHDVGKTLVAVLALPPLPQFFLLPSFWSLWFITEQTHTRQLTWNIFPKEVCPMWFSNKSQINQKWLFWYINRNPNVRNKLSANFDFLAFAPRRLILAHLAYLHHLKAFQCSFKYYLEITKPEKSQWPIRIKCNVIINRWEVIV